MDILQKHFPQALRFVFQSIAGNPIVALVIRQTLFFRYALYGYTLYILYVFLKNPLKSPP
jgi:hypothetical protein